ncbi:phage portal protein family protein [Cerasicoccus maritimus]|uniref:phage portal protein family protein n=1 Tax=Cerasicoccus maritimus TaxID=490089 RepID=UPI0028527858|nr:DUF935 family protein [Cerasicoccus maritimus]
MSKLSLSSRFRVLVSGKIPEKTIPTTAATPRWRRLGDEPRSTAEDLDVDRLHAILESAEHGQVSDLFALYRDILASDSHLQAEFAKRKLAIIGDALSVQPIDDGESADEEAAELVEDQIQCLTAWPHALAHLLDSTLWPVAVLEKVYRPSSKPGLRYELAELVPVPHQLLDYTTGRMMIRNVDPETKATLQTYHEPDPNRYIVHRGHILSLPDYWGGPMRSLVFWWLLSAMDRTWWANFLDKYGTPFPVGKFDRNDDAGRSVLQLAFQWAKKLGGLVVTKETEVELLEAGRADAGDAYEKFYSICQREKSKLILGQTLSAEAQSTGLGSGVSKQQESVRQDIRQFDGLLLGSTLRDQLFRQFLLINGKKGDVPTLAWGSESIEESKALSDILTSLSNAGIHVADESLPVLSKRIGLTLERKPQPAALQSAQPAEQQQQALSEKALKENQQAEEDRDFRSLMANAEIVGPKLRALAAQSPEDPEDAIIRNTTADLSQVFRGSLAPVRQLIRESESPEDLEAKLRTFYTDWQPGRVQVLITEALTAFLANGVSTAES